MEADDIINRLVKKHEEENKKVDFRMKFVLEIPRWYPKLEILMALKNYCFKENLKLYIDDYGGLLIKTYYIEIKGSCTYKESQMYYEDIRSWMNRLTNH